MIKVLLIILLLTIPIWAGNFGNEQSTVSDVLSIEDYIVGSGFACDSTGVADTIYVQLQNTDATARNVYAAIYRSSDSSFVDSTAWVSITAVDSAVWYAFPLANAPTVKADSSYVLMAWAQATAGTCYMLLDRDQVGENYRRKYVQWASNDWPATLSGFTFGTNATCHIYVKYTTTPPAGGGGRKCPVTH